MSYRLVCVRTLVIPNNFQSIIIQNLDFLFWYFPSIFRFSSIVTFKIFYDGNFVLIQIRHGSFWDKSEMKSDCLLSEIISFLQKFKHSKSLKRTCTYAKKEKRIKI